MPLTTCPDCAKEISDQARACIHCGRPMVRLTGPVVLSNAMTRAEIAQAVKEGEQRAQGRRTLGSLIAFAALAFGFIAVFWSPVLALLIVLVGLGAACWVNYGW